MEYIDRNQPGFAGDDEGNHEPLDDNKIRQISLAHINTKNYSQLQIREELEKRSRKIREEFAKAEMMKMKKYQKLLGIQDDLDSESDCRSYEDEEEIEIKTIKLVSDFPSLLKYNQPVKIYDLKKLEKLEILEPDAMQTMSIQKILNTLFPPQCWRTKEGVLMQSTISPTLVHRDVVDNLEESFNLRLEATEARNKDVCSIRREIYRQCFDELIRQITIDSPSTGLLLWRIRDEIDMTMHAYETLFQSSVEFGRDMACESQDDEETDDLEARVRILEKEKKELEESFRGIREKNDQMIQRSTELRESEEQRVVERLNFLKNVTNQLRAQIEGIMNIK